MENQQINSNSEILVPFSLSKIAKKIAFLITSLIIFLPLIPNTGLFLFPIGRDLIFKILVEMLFASALIHYFSSSAQKLKDDRKTEKPLDKNKSVIIVLILAFWFFYTLSFIFSLQPSFSFWGNIYKNSGWLTMTHLILFFFSILYFFAKKDWLLFFKIASFPAIIVSALAIFQSANGVSRPSSTLNNPDFLSAYLIIIIPILFYLSSFWQKRLLNKKDIPIFNISLGWQKFFSFVFCFSLITLLLTKTRSGYFALFLEIIVILIWYLSKKYRRIFIAAISLFIISLVLIFSLSPIQNFINKLNNPIVNRFLSLKEIHSDSLGRISAYKAGLKGIIKKPLVGYGPENFLVAYDSFYDGSLNSNGTLENPDSLWKTWFDKAHNIYIDKSVTGGLLSSIPYFLVFVFLLFLLRKEKNAFLFAVFIGYLGQGLINFDTLVPLIYLFFLIAFSLKENHSTDKDESNKPLAMNKNEKFIPIQKAIPFYTLLFSVILLAIYPIASVSLKAFSANYYLNKGENECQYSFAYNRIGAKKLAEEKEENCFADFDKSLKIDSPMISRFVRIRYGYWALKLPLNKKQLVNALEKQKKNSQKGEFPYFTRNYIYGGFIAKKLYQKTKNPDYLQEMNNNFKKAIKLSPNRPVPLPTS